MKATNGNAVLCGNSSALRHNRFHRRALARVCLAVLPPVFLFVFTPKATGTAAASTCAPPPPGLVSWWPGDGNASDIAGTNNGTLLNGATFGSGIVGEAFRFDGVDDHVSIPNSASLQLSAQFTIEFWFSPATTITPAHTESPTFISKGVDDTIDLANNDGRIEVRGPTPRLFSTNDTWLSNTWHHVVLSYAANTYRLFIDGQQHATESSTHSILNNTNPLHLGRMTGSFQGYYAPFNGLLDEVRIFNRALSSDEIAAIYSAGGAAICHPVARLCDTNLIVVRLGDGDQTLTNTGNSIFLDQFTTSGSHLNTVSVPHSGPTGSVMVGNSFVEGYLSRSMDGSLLSFAAYGTNMDSGVNVTTSANVPRVVATFDAAATYNRAVVTSSDYTGVAWRSAATDGTNNFWGAGASGGTVYLGHNAPRAVVQNSKPNARVVHIFNGNLYMSSGSAAGDGRTGIYRFNGLPKSDAGLPPAIVFTNTFESIQGITDFAVNSSATIIYFADDRPPAGVVGGIQRWNFDFANNIWTNAYNLTNGLGALGVSHLEVDWSGPDPVAYATTKEGSQNRLVKVTDTGAGSPFITLATAGTNQVFRGVKFGPSVRTPFIATHPQSRTNVIGGVASFSVAAGGTGPFSYQWMFNGVPLTNSARVSGAQSATLTISPAQTNDAGVYRAIVTGGSGPMMSAAAQWTVIFAPGINASLIAYEGFDYAGGSDLSGQSGSYGWATAWTANVVGDTVLTKGSNGSLEYSDALGNSLLTSGNSFFHTASSLASGDSRTFRNLLGARGADNTTTWIAFLGQRVGPTTNLTANPYPRGATPISLYSGATEKLGIGNGSGATSNTWALLPDGQVANLRSSSLSFSNLTLIVVRLDHKPGNDDAYLFINPTLGSEPQPSQAAAQSLGTFDFSFNRIRPFVGANDAANGRPYAELHLDEIRIGNTFASVTPFVPSGAAAALMAYFQDFEGVIGSEWLQTNISTTPIGGRRFLGEFGNRPAQVSLTNLAPHTLLRVSFDVFVIRSWDGNSTSYGPDLFRLNRGGSTPLFGATFNNFFGPAFSTLGLDAVAAGQSFPDGFVSIASAPTLPPGTGAAEINTLGYLFQGSILPAAVVQDSVYRVSTMTAHTGSSLFLGFSASGLEGLENESWGLDNVQVEAFNLPQGSLVSLEILPLPVLYPGSPGETEPQVVGRFTNGVTLALSASAGVLLSSENTSIFVVTTNGTISPVGSGAANLVASYLGLSTTTSVTVLAPIALRQSIPAQLHAGGLPVNAFLFADFPGATNVNITGYPGALRSSSDPGVAPITSAGLVTPRKPGLATLAAIYAGLTNHVPVTVVLPPAFQPGALAHRYSFSEPINSTTVSDSVGGADGQLINRVSGASTNNFDGSGQLNLGGGVGGSATAAYVNLPNGLVSTRQSVTMEGWVTWNGPVGASWPRIFDFGRNQAADASGDFIEDQFNGTGLSYMFLTPYAGSTGISGIGLGNRARFSLRQGAGTETSLLEASSPLAVSNQTHFVVVYDPPSGVARLYLNGQRVATTAAFLPLSGVEDRNVWLGRSQWSSDVFFNGLYNEFRIYDGALLDDDVQASFNAGPDAFSGSLAGPPNDHFTNATVMIGSVLTVTGANVGASREPGESAHAGDPGGSSVWWTWTSPAGGTVAVTATNSSLNARLAVYTGDTVSNLTEVISGTNSLAFSGSNGVTYRIAVDGPSGATGRIVIALTAGVPPVVSTAPQPRRAAVGTTVSFTSLGTGVGPISYLWLRDGQPVPGANLATFTLSNVQLTNAGVYSVVVGNLFGNTTNSSGVLTIEAPYTITTHAGAAGVAGSGNDLRLAARFNQPHDVALDQSGNIYIAEHINDDIRKISGDTVMTLAGLAGSAGSVNGTGSAARFNNPWGLAVDTSGNVFVADAFNHAIRKITPDGTVTTFAGSLGVSGAADGQGSASRFNRPRDLAFGPEGQLYVADQMNHVIRVITTNGVVSTLAGRAGIAGSSDGMGTNAFFNTPGSLTVDAAGQVFVAEEINSTIRKITPAGVVTTFAGKAGYSGSRDGPGAFARFGTPSHISADGAGNLFMTDVGSDTIRRITPDGMVSTVAGLSGVSGTLDGTGRGARFNDPRGIAADSAGNIYIADILNHTIRRGSPSAGIVIQQQPGNLTLSEGGAADIFVQVDGRGPFLYQWLFNGGLVTGATQAVLHLNPLTLADAGQYQLRIRTLDGLEEVFSSPTSLEVRKLSWQFAGTPGLPLGVTLADVWARRTNEAYTVGWKPRSSKSDIPDTYLYRWDGSTWSVSANFPGHYPGRVLGVGTNELWLTLSRCALGSLDGCGADHGGKIYRSTDGGTNWTLQTLPLEAANREFRTLSGTPANIHVVADGGLILRFNGFGWTSAFSDPAESVNAHTLLSANEGYFVTCWGWGSWDGNAWSFRGRQFDFCEVSATWAANGPEGLHWYAVGNNSSADGVRVWRFDPASQSFGGRTNFVFSDGAGPNVGSATGVWGSAPDDVYVIGELAEAPGAARSGRIYHFDGAAWSPVTEFGEIPPPRAIHGTAHDDVWIALSDGRLLHRSSAVGTNSPPVITTPPQDRSVVVNTTGGFSVVAQGTPPLWHQWQFNNEILTGATNPVLLLAAVQPTHAGSYRVIVTNAFGATTSASVSLNVIVPPSFTAQPEGTNVLVGADLTLSVAVNGAADFQWRKNGANIEGATNASFTISNVQFNDGGSYTVVVANEAGAVTSERAEVIVLPLTPPAAADYFTNRLLLTLGLTGGPPVIVSGFNTNATKETGEPDHAGEPGGRSVWYTWTAPVSGIARFNTYGSTFDTVLAVYTGTTVSKLVEIAVNDDDASNDPDLVANRFFASEVRFNARAGTNYAVAVDGFGGEGGYFVLLGELEVTNALLPEIAVQPENQIRQLGSNVTFSVTAIGTNLAYQWHFNGLPLPGATDRQLSRTNIGLANVGTYAVRVSDMLTGRYLDSRRVVLEISSDPAQGIVFADKLDVLVRTQPLPRPGIKTWQIQAARETSFFSVSAGTVGYHIGNNQEGLTDLDEVNHANLIGVASLFFSFETSTAGTLVVDTGGSGIDNLFAVYADHVNYDLLPSRLLGFATNAASATNVNRVAVTSGPGGGQFVVAADGLKGRRGPLRLNWSFGTPPQAAASTNPPPLQQLSSGGSLTLRLDDPAITNAVPTPRYIWYRDDVFLAETLDPFYVLTQADVNDSGTYRVVSINDIGSTTNVLNRVLINQALNIDQASGHMRDGVFEFVLNGTEGDAAVIQATTNLIRWADLTIERLTGYERTFRDLQAPAFTQRYYRVVREGSFMHLASSLKVVDAGMIPDVGYHFTVPPSIEVPLIVDVSTNLQHWVPVHTNDLNPAATIFIDPAATNLALRYYRLRLSR